MAKRIKPEAAVQRAVLDLLAAERVFAVRLNTGAFRDATGRPVFMHSGGAGVADILAFPRIRPSMMVPQPLWIECKSAKGLQTIEQKQFQCKVESEGHAYLVARGSEDVLEWLKARRR